MQAQARRRPQASHIDRPIGLLPCPGRMTPSAGSHVRTSKMSLHAAMSRNSRRSPSPRPMTRGTSLHRFDYPNLQPAYIDLCPRHSLHRKHPSSMALPWLSLAWHKNVLPSPFMSHHSFPCTSVVVPACHQQQVAAPFTLSHCPSACSLLPHQS